jgi:hypothetical protein
MDNLTIKVPQKVLVRISGKSQISKIINVIKLDINDILYVDNCLIGSKTTLIKQNIKVKRKKKVIMTGIILDKKL